MSAEERSSRPVWLGADERRWDHFRVHTSTLHCGCLGPYEFSVYCALIAHAEVDSGKSWPSVQTLASYFRISERRVTAAIRSLEEGGWIRTDQRSGKASYYFVLPPPHPSTPASGAGVDEGDPRRSEQQPLHLLRGTPAPRADEQEPLTRTTNKNSSADADASAFERFWKAYPKKVDKRAGERAWKAAIKRADPETIIRAVEPYVRTADRRFYKNPATWLNADAWLNEYDEPPEENDMGWVSV